MGELERMMTAPISGKHEAGLTGEDLGYFDADVQTSAPRTNPHQHSARARELERESGERRPSSAEILELFDRLITLCFSRSDVTLCLEAMGPEWRLELKRALDELFRAKVRVEQADLVAATPE